MNKYELISIIVPVYNVQDYLVRCIESIIRQSYVNIEIILVDDGSTDDSRKICDDYSKIDSRIKVIHKKNGGLSSARNAGLEKAKGNIISFIDSDDWVEDNFIEMMYNIIFEYDVDVVSCRMVHINNYTEYNKKGDKVKLYSGIDSFKEVMSGKDIEISSCNKLYKRDTIGDVRFPAGMLHEDCEFVPRVLLRANKVAVYDQALYNYRHRPNSLTTGVFSFAVFDVIKNFINLEKEISVNAPELIKYVYFRKIWGCFIVLDRMIMAKYKSNTPVYKAVRNELIRNSIYILKENGFSVSRKLGVVLLMLNISLYEWLVRKKNCKLKSN